MSFIQNKHIKLDETCIGTQCCFKENLSNVMDVLGRLTSKLYENLHTSDLHHNKSFKDLITSRTTYKHIKPHMRHIGDLVVECLGRPLTFDLQCTYTLRHCLNTTL